MQRNGIQFSGLALAAVALVAAWMLLATSSAGAVGNCDRVASSSGSDSAAGTMASPFRSAQRLVDSLGNGQTGCFRNGVFEGVEDTIEVRTAGITLTSYPDERGTLKGELKIEKGADHVNVTNLDIDGRSPWNLGPMVFAAYTTFDNVDVTNYNQGICFILGANDPAYGRAVGTVIQNSRIHNCGQLPAQNGDHGIYIEHSDGAIIRNNWIYDNADRGIQLYPDSQGTKIYGNVIDGNGEGVIISGDDDSGSSNNVVYDNVISNSRVRWNVESSWGDGPVGTGNVVRDNCVWASNPTSSAKYYNTDGGILPASYGARGYTSYGNVVAEPRFVDAPSNNFDLQADSPCAGPARAVTLTANDNQVNSGALVALQGSVSPVKSTRVTIQILRHGHWKKFARTHTRVNGKFKVRKRLRGRLVADRARLRARVPRVGNSKTVAIRVN
jgi:parallel beta-helix repeat protein